MPKHCGTKPEPKAVKETQQHSGGALTQKTETHSGLLGGMHREVDVLRIERG